MVMEGGVTWESLGYVVGAVGIGIGLYWRATVIFASAKDLEKIEKRLDVLDDHPSTCPFVSRENLELQLKPIRDEAEHRKRSMDNLGKAFVDMSQMVHRMDKALVAIATHLKVELPDSDKAN